MKQHVTVVPSDSLIIVDGTSLTFPFAAPSNLHALQWHEGVGHIEWEDAINKPLSGEAAYVEEVAPYVALWEGEQARVAAEIAAEEARKETEYNSSEARALRLRAERDRRISATDYLMAVDYPLSEAARDAVRAYRQALRDITQQEGFPWLGGGADDSLCPWPVQGAG